MDSLEGLDFGIAADTFYECLEDEFPGVISMFSDMHSQRVMFVSALKSIDQLYDNDRQLLEYIELLGEKHKKAGVLKIHMDGGERAFSKAIDAAGPTIDEQRKLRLKDAFTKLRETMGY